ncbi:MAG: hypothetical protein NTW29_02820 [Bacteroidetes bacterium]|nr:hypothetical protein [Bacteroidota bacterium]
MNINIHNNDIPDKVKDERSSVLHSYISENQPFYIRWGMFAVAGLIIIIIVTSLLIRVRAETLLNGRLTILTPPANPLQPEAEIIIAGKQPALCALKPGEKIRLSIPVKPEGDRLHLNSRVQQNYCGEINRLKLALDTGGLATFLKEWDKKPGEPVQIQFKSGRVSLFSYLYRM